MNIRLPHHLLFLMLVCALASCARLASEAPTSLLTQTLQPASPTALPPTNTPLPSATSIQQASSTPTASPSPTPSSAPTVPPTAQPSSTSVPAALHYTFPVRSKGKISYGRFHHDYPAADIFCPVGSEFVAVTSGVVDFVSREDVWDSKVNDGATRGGLSVAIIGDDGLRYYGSHLSAVADGIAPGVRVEMGQLLGLTGKSGDAAVTNSHLHFGISHPTTPDDWATRRGEIPPYTYLKSWQSGKDLSPALSQ